ncbi:MAG: FHA domain-containing protein [Ignavibacteriaceae bacterium]|nr:FHA domain-containing protein [Ignavibacteriaceae bacterium]
MNNSEIRTVTLGRASHNEIVINNPGVSSKHALFKIEKNRVILEDVNSTNGTFVNEQKITSIEIDQADKINFGKNYTFDWKMLEPFLTAPAILPTPLTPSEERLRTKVALEKTKINIGRSSDNDLVINNIKVSRKHARLEKVEDEWFVEDLKSSNGTFVNSKKIERAKVTASDVITIGGIPLNLERLFAGEKVISGDLQIAANDLTFRVSNKIIVDQIGLTILPGEFVGLIGPSGAGKTTLMMMMNGVTKPSDGDVLINSQSLYSNIDSFKGQIGYVPQDDIIHRELKVKESFNYTGKLRLDSTPDTEISAQVESVLDTLGLNDTKETLIGSAEKKGISGGQRKRVNLGQELLTEPSILFLDEPTSGLDPKTDLDVMNLLRGIASKGKIIILTTHNITKENFEILTHLIVLSKGGKLAYFGKANRAAEYFEADQPYEIFEKLETQDPDYWKNKFRQSPQYEIFVDNRKSTTFENRGTGSSKGKKRSAGLKQFSTLTSRYFRVKLRDQVSTAILLLQAPIIALLIALVFDAPEERTAALFILVIAAIWLGCSNAAREIVSEHSIYRRERMVNLKIPSYIFSKITVLLLLCVIQCGILVGIAVPALGMEVSFSAMFFLLLLTSLQSLLLGLLISSLVNTTEAAMGLIPLVLIPQVILGGLITIFEYMSDFEKILAAFNPSRWAFEAATILEFEEFEPQRIMSIGFDPDNLAVNIFVLLIFSTAFYLLTAYSLKRKDIR